MGKLRTAPRVRVGQSNILGPQYDSPGGGEQAAVGKVFCARLEDLEESHQ